MQTNNEGIVANQQVLKDIRRLKSLMSKLYQRVDGVVDIVNSWSGDWSDYKYSEYHEELDKLTDLLKQVQTHTNIIENMAEDALSQ